MKLRLTNIGISVLLLLGSSSATFAADEKPTGTIEFQELDTSELLMKEISIIGSKFNVKNIAGSAAYLDVQDIRQHNVADVNKLLRRVPGVIVRPEDGFGVFPNISLRGVDSARSAKVTLMEDGILTAPAPYSAPDAYYAPGLGRMSGLEVVKGSSQVKYGPRTTGGVINYLSTPIPTSETYYMKSSYGTFDEFRNHTYFGNTEQLESGGKIGYLVEYFGRNNTGFMQLDQNPASIRGDADTGLRRIEPMLKISYEPKSSNYQRFEFKYGHTDLDFNQSYLGTTTNDFYEKPTRRYAAARFDEMVNEHHRTYLRHFLEIDSKTNLVTTVYGNAFHRNWSRLQQAGTSSATLKGLSKALADSSTLAVLKGEAAGSLQLAIGNRSYYLYGAQANLSHQTKMGETDHKIEVGLRYHYDQIRRWQQNETYTQDSGGNITAESIGAPGSGGNRVQKTDAVALNIQDAIKWKKFTFTPGVRAEYLHQYWKDISQTTTEVDGDKDYIPIVGGASLKYDMYDANGEDIDLFGGIFRGFSTPDPKSAFESNLREETSVGYEVGARYANAPKAFSAEAIFFLTDLEDLILEDDIGAAATNDTINGGDVRSLGMEFVANYDYGLAKNLSFQTPSYVSFTYTDATIETDLDSSAAGSIFAGGQKGNKVPYVAAFVISAGAGVIYKKFNANIDANYTSETYADGANSDANVDTNGVADERFGKIPDRFIVDVAVGYQINKRVRLFSNVKNITNTQEIVSREPRGPRGNLPISMMAGLEFRL